VRFRLPQEACSSTSLSDLGDKAMRGFPGLVAALCLLAGCHATPAEPQVDGAWVRLPAVAGNPGAAYFTLHGGKAADTLVSVAASGAGRAELHESMGGGGKMASMAPIHDVALAPSGELTFAPGGRHVMLFDLQPQVKPGTAITLSVTLGSGKRLDTQAKVVGAGDPPPE
jgi:periplasmic copper chaperone A